MITIEFLDLEINNKIYKRIFAIGIVLIVCYCVFTFFYFSLPCIYNMEKNTIVDENNTIKTGINSIYKGNIRLKIFGWAYKEDQDIQTFNSCYILKNIETGKMYKIRAQMKEIPELQNVDAKYCFSRSGLESQSIVIGMKKGIYDVYILYKNDNENMLVNTGIQANI